MPKLLGIQKAGYTSSIHEKTGGQEMDRHPAVMCVDHADEMLKAL